MRILVTGSSGFVMSVFIERVLHDHPETEVVAVDLNAPDDTLLRYLAAGDRLTFHTFDVRERRAVVDLLAAVRPDVVVHAATMTHVIEWEATRPTDFVDVNVTGTLNVLEAARLAGVRRVVNVSSAAVYGSASAEGESGLSEHQILRPTSLYGISKVTGELVGERYAALYGMEVPSTRFTAVFGAMERPSSSRAAMSLLYHLARSRALATPLVLTSRAVSAHGDWLSAVDVARGLIELCFRPTVESTAYNMSNGMQATVRELIAFFGTEVRVDDSDPDALDVPPEKVYPTLDCNKVERALAWQSREMHDQVAEYRDWAMANPDFFVTHPVASRALS